MTDRQQLVKGNPSRYAHLSAFEQWMVASNIKTIKAGTPADQIIGTLRAGGYCRVADVVEADCKREGLK